MSGSGLSGERLDRMRDVMSGHVERGDVPGLVTLVYRRGEARVEALGTMAAGGTVPMRRDSIFRIASLTKPITAVAAMILVEECVLRLDEPVDQLLPELAGRRVLRRLDGPLDDTVPARRSITLRDLLTFRLGIGSVLAPRGTHPIQRAMDEAGLTPSPNPPSIGPDEWMKRLGALPLVHQPGEQWMYHTGSEVLGVLIARAAGQSFASFLSDRIFDPLGMRDTAFHVPPEKLDRLPPSYRMRPRTAELALHDDPADSRWGRPVAFPSGGGGLVSTADDYLAFCRMMLDGGRHGSERVLSRPSVEVMTSNHLSAEQRPGTHSFLGPDEGWGFGLSVSVRRFDLATTPGRFGWNGGTGTSAYTDPGEGLVGILLTQRHMDSTAPPPVFQDFWTSAYRAIDD
ncbi:serine hydrolase domain-containing protein [Streptomyces sp. SPB162]|uniref:serine hydrolase domain-containing protein n=1 Tax=Streptomyces sp. SPB162 TaxID=2940560 RepID=UPI002407310D|nr:serine hydrolase domain-containing protein [Streptomyces sp. SPB162]MDF9811224.1 CubicO group peptidase (beta-lactamase class C family) [Streptomyces sp. SPB162]